MGNEFEIFSQIAKAKMGGQTVALATVVSTYKSAPRKAGTKMLIYADGKTVGTIGGGILEAEVIKQAREAISTGTPVKRTYNLDAEKIEEGKMICGGEVEVFIDVFCAEASLIILGGGHVGESIARLSEAIGMPYVVVDDREEFASRERFPHASQVFRGPYEEAFKEIAVNRDSYVVICTRGHAYDLLCLKEALKTEAAYIGVIASKKKASQFREQLKKEGVRIDDPRVFSPIGLDLGDSSPGQIALSVMAEVVKLKSGGSGSHKRLQN